MQSPSSGGIRWTSTPWGDDLAMIIVMLLIIPVSAMSVVLAYAGLGRDIWTLPFEHITKIQGSTLSQCALGGEDLDAVDLSPEVPFEALQTAYVVIGSNVGYYIAFVLISIFQCTPVPLAWTHWGGEFGDGHCNNINAQDWTSALFNAILDIMTLLEVPAQ